MGWFQKKDKPADPPPELAELLHKLGDEDWQVRLAAARAIGDLGPQAVSAIPALEELIVDQNGDVCNAAAEAMSKIER
jgi:HEAT repeat protein